MTIGVPDGGLCVWPLSGIPEVGTGDDLVVMIADAAKGTLIDGDVVAISSKIVSKAEGRIRSARDRESAISEETVRVVASRTHATGVTRIVENHLGLVMAAAGVDSSNTADGTVLLLPKDPDKSARIICTGLRAVLGVQVGVVITDTFGRPWRQAQTDLAIGAAGVAVFDDFRGGLDTHGRQLDVAVTAVVDEIASAADLVKGKTRGTPVAVVRGLGKYVSELDTPGASALIRSAEEDLFSEGTAEAERRGFRRGLLEAGAFGQALPDAVTDMTSGERMPEFGK